MVCNDLPINKLSSSTTILVSCVYTVYGTGSVGVGHTRLVSLTLCTRRSCLRVGINGVSRDYRICSGGSRLLCLSALSSSCGLVPADRGVPPCRFTIVFSNGREGLTGATFGSEISRTGTTSFTLHTFTKVPCNDFGSSCVHSIPGRIFSRFGNGVPPT